MSKKISLQIVTVSIFTLTVLTCADKYGSSEEDLSFPVFSAREVAIFSEMDAGELVDSGYVLIGFEESQLKMRACDRRNACVSYFSNQLAMEQVLIGAAERGADKVSLIRKYLSLRAIKASECQQGECKIIGHEEWWYFQVLNWRFEPLLSQSELNQGNMIKAHEAMMEAFSTDVRNAPFEFSGKNSRVMRYEGKGMRQNNNMKPEIHSLFITELSLKDEHDQLAVLRQFVFEHDMAEFSASLDDLDLNFKKKWFNDVLIFDLLEYDRVDTIKKHFDLLQDPVLNMSKITAKICMSRNVELLEMFVQAGLDVNVLTDQGVPAYFNCFEQAQEHLLKWMIDNKQISGSEKAFVSDGLKLLIKNENEVLERFMAFLVSSGLLSSAVCNFERPLFELALYSRSVNNLIVILESCKRDSVFVHDSVKYLLESKQSDLVLQKLNRLMKSRVIQDVKIEGLYSQDEYALLVGAEAYYRLWREYEESQNLKGLQK